MSLYDQRRGQPDRPRTFNNNVLNMSAGIAGCTLLSQEVLNNLNYLRAIMTLEIDQVIRNHKIRGVTSIAPIMDEAYIPPSGVPPKTFITGTGSLMNVHFSSPEKELLQRLFWYHMLQNGIYLAQQGFNTLSIEVQPFNVDLFARAVESFCQTWQQCLANA